MRLSFPKSINALGQVFAALENFADANRLSEDVRSSVNLAIEELFVNCVKHATQSDQEITIELKIESGAMLISLTDHDVERFDITATDDGEVRKPIARRRAGGMGLHLVKSVMDDLTYDYVGRTSVIRLMKRLEK